MERVRLPDINEAAQDLGWAFWLAWVLANSVGWIVGMCLSWLISILVAPLLEGAWMVAFWGVGGMIVGINFGINQWFLLRPLSPDTLGGRANWWVVATVIGWAVSLAIVIGSGAGAKIGLPLIGTLIGVAVGLPQTLVIASGIGRRWLWLIGHTLAWTAALAVIPLVDRAVGFALAGVISGAIGGAALIWIIGSERSGEA